MLALWNLWPQLTRLGVDYWSRTANHKLGWLNQTISLENWNRRIQRETLWWTLELKSYVEPALKCDGWEAPELVCHWPARCCFLVAWQDCTSFFFFFGFIYIWMSKTWNNTNLEINLSNRTANHLVSIYIHEALSGKMLTKWTLPSPCFSRKASQLVGKKCITCL